MLQDTRYHIFISYRRDGGDDLAILLEERLTRLGYRVFLDVESLRSGDFNVKLLDAIEQCTDFLLVLPEHALDRCIDDPGDWVRREIRHALEHGKNIIPVMKRNFVFPDNLPEDIADVRNKHGVAASMDDFNSVMNRIVTKFLHSKPDDEDDEVLRQRAVSGDMTAVNELAMRYEYGSAGITSNTQRAFELYCQAVDGKCQAAMYNLGDIYERCSSNFTLIKDYGINVDRGEKSVQTISEDLFAQAVEFYEKAANLGFAPALYKRGNIHERDKELEKALSCYKRAAEMSYPPAQNAMGFFCQNGIGREENLKQAEEWYEKAAKAQYAPAIYNYAMLIHAEQPEKALNLLRRIAFGDQALPMATYALGRMYELSFGDMRNAAECYRHAADAGVEAAEVDLERCRYVFA